MYLLVSPNHNPTFNIAAEEYLFRNVEADLLFLYRNEPAVVVGKHQNALKEADYWFLKENKIPLVRRISGGGTVFHDLQNINFSFHKTVDDPAKTAFKLFNEPIIDFLKTQGIEAEIGKRNDIFIEGYKVSGHAEHVFKKRIMSHGTLLYNSDLSSLSGALKGSKACIEGKSVESVRKPVRNIATFLSKEEPVEDFQQKLAQYFYKKGWNKLTLNNETLIEIEKLQKEKYSTWEWNYGYSPTFVLKNRLKSEAAGDIIIELSVKKGIIINAMIARNGEKVSAINSLLVNEPLYEPRVIELLSKNIDIAEHFNLNVAELVSAMF